MRSRLSRPSCLGRYVKMAASVLSTLLRRLPRFSPSRGAAGVQVPLQSLCMEAPSEEDSLSQLPTSPYENEPWKYLDSEGTSEWGGEGQVGSEINGQRHLLHPHPGIS